MTYFKLRVQVSTGLPQVQRNRNPLVSDASTSCDYADRDTDMDVRCSAPGANVCQG